MDIAETSGALAPSLSTRLFDPAQWLAVYVELGGGYSVSSRGAYLHWPRDISRQERSWLFEHERQIRADVTRQTAVGDYLASLCPREPVA